MIPTFLGVLGVVGIIASASFLCLGLFRMVSRFRTRNPSGEGWKVLRLLYSPDVGWVVSGTSTGAISAHPLRGARAMCMLAQRCSAQLDDGRIANERCDCGFHAVYSLAYPMMDELRYGEHASRCFLARVKLSGAVTYSQHAMRGERQDILEVRLPERCVSCSQEPAFLEVSAFGRGAHVSCGKCDAQPASQNNRTSRFVDSDGTVNEMRFVSGIKCRIEDVGAQMARQDVVLCYADGRPVVVSENDHKRAAIAHDASTWLASIVRNVSPEWVANNRKRIESAADAASLSFSDVLISIVQSFSAANISSFPDQAVALMRETEDGLRLADEQSDVGAAWRNALGIEIGDERAYLEMVLAVHGPEAEQLARLWVQAPARLRILHPIARLEQIIAADGQRNDLVASLTDR